MHIMSNLPLTQDQLVALFQEWVLLLFIFPGRGCFPIDEVVAKLSGVCKVALRINSWGLTQPIMAMPPPPLPGGGNNGQHTQLPPRVKDLRQRVLWHKLTVHERVYKRSGMDKCPICAQKEAIKLAMVECSLFKAGAVVIQHYFGSVATGDGEFRVRDMMESDH